MKRYLLTIGMVLAVLVMAGGQSYSLEERLWDAAERGDTEIVWMLHRQGAAINAKDIFGITALIWAAWQGRTEAVRALIAARADVNARNKYGNMALSFVKKNKHKEIVRILKAAGARE